MIPIPLCVSPHLKHIISDRPRSTRERRSKAVQNDTSRYFDEKIIQVLDDILVSYILYNQIFSNFIYNYTSLKKMLDYTSIILLNYDGI